MSFLNKFFKSFFTNKSKDLNNSEDDLENMLRADALRLGIDHDKHSTNLDQPDINDFDPFTFCCDHCWKQHTFTEAKIEKVKQKSPNSKNDYFILCHFCKKGHMQPPTFINSWWFFDDF